jgi:phosphate transport system substrate-binding protein
MPSKKRKAIMKKNVLLTSVVAFAITTGSALAADIKGSGASFPFSVYQGWIKSYNQATGIKVDYVKKGSSAGVKDIKAKSVDFAGTDEALSRGELASSNLAQIPSVIGAITMSYNIPGVKGLKLSREALAAIALGKVGFWDDAIIASANPGVNLPHQKLTFVHRADGSGTTFNFTYHLSMISPEWRSSFGADKTISWPGKQHIGGKTNTGVAALIKQTPYSIGYVDFADARSNGLSMAAVQNAKGQFVTPSVAAFKAAASGANFNPAKDFYAVITNPKVQGAYPMVAATYILIPKDASKSKEVAKFVRWSLEKGDSVAANLGFVPLTPDVTAKINSYLSSKGL